MRKLPFDRHLSLQNVKKVISEADGYQPHLIAPEQGYRRLIEGALNYFRGPSEASVDAVSCHVIYIPAGCEVSSGMHFQVCSICQNLLGEISSLTDLATVM